MGDVPPEASLPRVWCDFNACGWSGEPGDNCYYALDVGALAALGPAAGARVFVWDDEGGGEVIGCEGRLEPFRGGWRVRPVAGTWFRGRWGDVSPA
jgi:hypothetical protein